MENKKRKDGKEKKKMIKGKNQLKKTSRDILKHKKKRKTRKTNVKGKCKQKSLVLKGSGCLACMHKYEARRFNFGLISVSKI